jgi:hypothetical protein
MTICSHSVEGVRSWQCSLDPTRRVCYGSVQDAKKGRPDFCPLYGDNENESEDIFGDTAEEDL